MNKYTILSFQISLILISGIISSYPENYTMPYLFSVRIGRQSTEISLLLNSFSSNNILFTNSNRKYSKEISSKRKMDVFMDKLEFNAHIIPDFPFSLILDNTELNSPGIQGEFGLGIDKENRNDLIENLFSNQVISKRKLLLETSNDLKPKIYTNTESVANNFKYCNLTRKSDLDNLYEESWICELSHLIKEEENLGNKTIWENAKLIMARAVFDTRQRNIILPIKYLDNFKDYWNLEKCEEVYNQSLNEKYFKCDKRSFDQKPIYFVIDGYGLKFTFDDLFIIDGKFKRSIISFTNTISNSNLFIFGMPLFKKYNIMFDFENKRVGLKGENIIDFNKDYSKWKEEKSIIKINESNVISVSWTNERTILIIGTTVGILIILYILFYVIRSFKRDNKNKTHSKFVEEVKDH